MTVVHILRDSLPWRPEMRSECGRLQPAHWVTWEDHVARPLGETCKTCARMTSHRYGLFPARYSWARNPGLVMARYLSDAEFRPDDLTNVELWAIADMIKDRADEFVMRCHVVRQRQALKAGLNR